MDSIQTSKEEGRERDKHTSRCMFQNSDTFKSQGKSSAGKEGENGATLVEEY